MFIEVDIAYIVPIAYNLALYQLIASENSARRELTEDTIRAEVTGQGVHPWLTPNHQKACVFAFA